MKEKRELYQVRIEDSDGYKYERMISLPMGTNALKAHEAFSALWDSEGRKDKSSPQKVVVERHKNHLVYNYD